MMWCQISNIFFQFRYDYENCEAAPCNEMMKLLEEKVTHSSFAAQVLESGGKKYTVKLGDNFQYTDPIDRSVATNQVSLNKIFLMIGCVSV